MDLSYPIGKAQIPADISEEDIKTWIGEVGQSPELLRRALEGLNDAQLDTPYRPEGWTVRQVVHHLADTHMHTFTNFKHALTEDNPLIHPIDIAKFAALGDSAHADIETSLKMFEGIQLRWVQLMESMTREQFHRTFEHPRSGTRKLDAILGVYAWHAKHHTAHITQLRARMNW